MRYIIEFSDDSAAFEDYGLTQYIDILEQAKKAIADALEGFTCITRESPVSLRDSNGNRVGHLIALSD